MSSRKLLPGGSPVSVLETMKCCSARTQCIAYIVVAASTLASTAILLVQALPTLFQSNG